MISIEYGMNDLLDDRIELIVSLILADDIPLPLQLLLEEP